MKRWGDTTTTQLGKVQRMLMDGATTLKRYAAFGIGYALLMGG